MPSREDLMNVLPRRALMLNMSGGVVISCTARKDGTLKDCAVVEETPPGEGVGVAALKLMSLFRLRPQTKDGQSVEGGSVRVPIRFNASR